MRFPNDFSWIEEEVAAKFSGGGYNSIEDREVETMPGRTRSLRVGVEVTETTRMCEAPRAASPEAAQILAVHVRVSPNIEGSEHTEAGGLADASMRRAGQCWSGG